MSEPFDLDALDDSEPFEIDTQAAHLFKHPHLGLEDVMDVWSSDPLFYPAKPPAHWLMLAEVNGRVLLVPLAPSRSGDRTLADRSAATRHLRASPPPTEGTVMSADRTPEMTADQEHEFYADPANQEPQGPARRRKRPMSTPVPVRFPADLLEDVKRAAEADDRSVSAWIRRAVEHELSRSSTTPTAR